jgi:transposase, IS5 family
MQLWQAPDPIAAALWQAEFGRYRPLIERIVGQTERRVFQGETVAASEKIVSLFEPHTDIIVKGGRDVEYGHSPRLQPRPLRPPQAGLTRALRRTARETG